MADVSFGGRARVAPRILISNDDGIDAHGLKVMEEIAAKISDDVWVVAPQTEQSGASHSLTLTEPLRMHEVGPKRYAVQGTPTDCVMLAVYHLLDGQRPDLLLSGINMGVNLGEDLTYSGTVAAAIEGALLGIPSIAISQQINWETGEAHWQSATAFAPDLIAKLLGTEWPSGVLMNINIPNLASGDIQGVQATVQGQRDASQMVIDERTDMRGAPYYWIGFREHVGEPHAETDLAAIDRGAISVTPLCIDLTDRAMRDRVAEILAGNGGSA
jgi:5'-nucleotidase